MCSADKLISHHCYLFVYSFKLMLLNIYFGIRPQIGDNDTKDRQKQNKKAASVRIWSKTKAYTNLNKSLKNSSSNMRMK